MQLSDPPIVEIYEYGYDKVGRFCCIIQRSGRRVSGGCNRCRTNAGFSPFPVCRFIRGEFGNSCGNCKWRDHVSRGFVVSAFIRGIQDPKLRNVVLGKDAATCGSLWKAHDIVYNSQRSLTLKEQMSEEPERGLSSEVPTLDIPCCHLSFSLPYIFLLSFPLFIVSLATKLCRR